MSPARPILTILALTLLASAGPVRAQSADDLFQRGLRAERVEGDLEAAIRYYMQVVELDDRALAARALLRIGQSYERLGIEGAERAYRRLVSDFADQTAAARAAQQKLQALTAAAATRGDAAAEEHGLSLRLLWGDAQSNDGRPTPDARQFVHVDWRGDWDLVVRDLATGESRLLAEGDRGRNYPTQAVVSPDAQRVAFFYVLGPWQPQLRVVDLDGTGERVLLENATGEIDNLFPQVWTPDGSEILTTIHWLDGHTSLAFVSAEDGTIRNLRSVQGEGFPRASLSPDGRWIAYDMQDRDEGQQSEIVVLAVDGSMERVVTSHPASDREPIWTPDGRHVVFASNRGGSVDLWAVRVQDGSARGEPFLLTRDVGEDFRAMRFTDDGSLVFGRDSGGGDIYSVGFDASTGTVTGTPRLEVPVYQGYNTAPAWSADLGRLVYLSRRNQAGGQFTRLIARDASGLEREPAPAIRMHRRIAWPRISPDGRLAALAPLDAPVEVVDLESGAVHQTSAPVTGDRSVAFSRDGRSLYYPVAPQSGAALPAGPDGEPFRGLVRHEIESDRWQPLYAWDANLYQISNQPGSWAVSPDETRVAYTTAIDAEAPFDAGTGWVMYVGDLRTGERTEVARKARHDGCRLVGHRSELAWSSDGSRILYVCQPDSEREASMRELMSVLAEGGEPESTGLVMRELRWISVRSDGRVGFAAGPTEYLEVWALSGIAGVIAAEEAR